MPASPAPGKGSVKEVERRFRYYRQEKHERPRAWKARGMGHIYVLTIPLAALSCVSQVPSNRRTKHEPLCGAWGVGCRSAAGAPFTARVVGNGGSGRPFL